MLDDAIEAATSFKALRADDLEFYSSVRGWAEIIETGAFDAYKTRFETTADFFRPRIREAAEISDRMIKTLQQKIL